MLKNSIAFEVVLAHRVLERMYRHGRHRIGRTDFAESHVKRVFVAVDVLVKEVGMFVVPERELKCFPTTKLIDNNLSTFKLRLVAIRHAAHVPDLARTGETAKVRPEDCAVFNVLRKFKEILRITHRHVVGVEKEHFAK